MPDSYPKGVIGGCGDKHNRYEHDEISAYPLRGTDAKSSSV